MKSARINFVNLNTVYDILDEYEKELVNKCADEEQLDEVRKIRRLIEIKFK